jgi:hypothetical protein
MRAVVTVALVLALLAAAPASAATISWNVKPDFDPVKTLQTSSSLPVREIKRVVAPIADFPSDHVHLMPMPPGALIDFLTTRENKAHAFIRIYVGKK